MMVAVGLPTHGGWVLGSPTGLSKSSLALNAAMVFGTSGPSVGMRFCAHASTTLADVYWLMTATNGTPGNVTWEIRNQNAAGQPGSTVHASGTVAWPGSANKYVKFSPGYSLTAGTTYWIVLSNADGTPGTNYPTLIYQGGTPHLGLSYTLMAGYRSSNGWNTAGTLATGNPVVLAFGDGTYLGGAYTSLVSYSSSTLERGMRVVSLDADMKISGLIASTLAGISAFRILADATAPGGSAIFSYSLTSQDVANGACRFPPQTLTRGTAYRLTLTIGSSTTAPFYLLNEDHATYSATANAGFLGGNAYGCIDNGAGGWTDSPDRIPAIGILVDSVIEVPSLDDIADAVWNYEDRQLTGS